MSIVTKVAKMRLHFHANMLDICNVANQLGILKDDKAEDVMKRHTMKCFDAMEHIGLDVKNIWNQKDESAMTLSFYADIATPFMKTGPLLSCSAKITSYIMER